MSLSRAFRRRSVLKNGYDWVGKPQPTVYHEDEDAAITGYTTLHPTKGWRTVSTKRLVAQAKMRVLLGV